MTTYPANAIVNGINKLRGPYFANDGPPGSDYMDGWGYFCLIFPEQETGNSFEPCRLEFTNSISGGSTAPATTNYTFTQNITTNTKTHTISCSYGYPTNSKACFYVKVKITSDSTKFRFCCGGNLGRDGDSYERVRWTTLNIDGVSVKLPIVESAQNADVKPYAEHFGYTVIPRLKSEFIETIVENETPAGPGGTQRGVNLSSSSYYLQGPSQYGNINKVIVGTTGPPGSFEAAGDNVAMVTEQITDEMTFVFFDINDQPDNTYIDNWLQSLIQIDTGT